MNKLSILFLVVLIAGCGGGGGDVVDATNGSAPVPAVYPATVSENGAMLNGIVIPNGLSTEVWFEHGADPSLLIFTPTSPHQSIGSGLSAIPVSVSIGGLTDNSTYYFRVCASNSKGLSRSSIQSFTTPSPGSPPAVTTAAATSVGLGTATLNGNVTANGLATDAWFEWGTDSTLSVAGATATHPVGSGTTSQSVNAALTGLTTGITYYYRVAARNDSGTDKGIIQSFTPGSAPAVNSLAAIPVGLDTATLNGNVTANGLATDAWFEWGTDSTLSVAGATATQPVGSGTTSQPVNAALAGLAAGNTYYYRIAASNASGTTKGTIRSFTPSAVPTVATLAATSIGPSTATLNGNVTANGLATDAWFEWGTDSTLVGFSSTPTQPVGSGTTSQPANAALAGLAAGNTYYYRLAASNSSGTTRGSIQSFIINAHRITTWPNNRKGAVSLGFDDGCPSHLSLAVPALNTRGFKGTFFLVTGDGSNPNWPDWNAWRNVAAQGHEIGSHTMTHPWLTQIPLAQAQEEMAASKAIIDAQIPAQKCLTFVYPFGDLNSSIKSYAQIMYIGAKAISCGLNSDPFDFGNLKACSPDDQGDIFAQADAAEAQGKWVDAFIHTVNAGADGCYGVWGYADWTAFLDHLLTKDLYVGTFGSLVKYSKERVSATLSVLSVSNDNIVLSLTDSLDDAIYDQPLTIRSEVPSGWDSVMVQQGGSNTLILPRIEGATRVIVYNALPDHGPITLRSP